ncbi:YhgE/Pip domain-containing protein [Alloscardovia criceti]|uniref:YhgE/Pip domain-containing protein n=1 Tax=Alloscardovia criceti TaxID=356828 RepID=UPI000362BDCD|nr:YhgE/Pip domain-containing protein [Alloscardovia criceti]
MAENQPQKKSRKPRALWQNPFVNIAKIFVEDQRHLFRNVIGVVVLMGLVIVPALYAWFNIAASWDPYGSTNQLKVAVANEDEGYQSDLIAVPLNVGNNVESSLRANDKLDWQFVSKDEAVEGVNAGTYYAAIVIPQDFSAHMMTVFSNDAQQASIEYYINEKSNAIAPRITQSAADTVVTQISSTFSESVAAVALNLADNVHTFATSDEGKQYVSTAVTRLNAVADDVDAAGNQLSSYAQLLTASAGLVDSSQSIISQGTQGAGDVKAELDNTVNSVKNLAQSSSASVSAVSTALESAASSLDSVSSQLDSLTAPISTSVDDMTQHMSTLGGAISQSSGRYDDLAASLTRVKDQVNSSSDLSDATKARLSSELDAVIASLNQASSDISTVGNRISTASQNISTAQSTISSQKEELKKQIEAVKATVQNAKNTYSSSVKPQLDDLSSKLNDTADKSQQASSSVHAVLNALEAKSATASATVDDVVAAMNDAHTTLGDSAQSLRNLATKLSDSVNAGTQSLSVLTDSDRSAVELAAELSSPVKLQRNAVFAIENYGSAMAGFYTILAIWVGSVFLVAMMKTSVSDKLKAKVLGLSSVEQLYENLPDKAKPHVAGNTTAFGLGLGSEYWGRYLTFLLISLFQSTLIIMGNLWFLKIQCENPWQLFLAAWMASLVFSTLMYALTLAFGAVGKAIAVVLMVMQVAGAGGTFPVELMPKFFQTVYPLLPFRYGLQAMHAAIAGSYQNEYWVALGKFALFLVPALIVGLIIARPLVRTNWVMEQLDKTGVYGE